MRKKNLNINKEKVIKDYYRMTCLEVVKRHNMGNSMIYRILSEYNMPRKGYNSPINPYINQTLMNQQILYGSLLGDGCVSKFPNYQESHTSKQRNYIKWKRNKLNIKISNRIRDYNYNGKNKKIKVYDIRSARNDPWCKDLRKLFYPRGVKVVTKEILDKIDELALLIWYLDDGSLQYKRDSNYSSSIILCTHSFTYNEHLTMQQWFRDKWGIDVTIHSNKKYHWLYFPVESTKKLLKILKPIFVKYKLPKCMEYKLWRSDNDRD